MKTETELNNIFSQLEEEIRAFRIKVIDVCLERKQTEMNLTKLYNQ